MITHTNKKVVYVKDIPSNIIEEAIFILKSDMDLSKNEKLQKRKREVILHEAEELIDSYAIDLKMQQLEEEKNRNKKKLKIIMIATIFVIICFLISIIL